MLDVYFQGVVAMNKLHSFMKEQHSARDQSASEPAPLLDRILASFNEEGAESRDTSDPEASTLPPKVTNLMVELLFGALETVASACCAAVLCLNKHPHVVDKLKATISEVSKERQGHLSYDDLMSLSYLNDVMTEVLRLMPPTVGAFRKTLKPIEVNVSLRGVVQTLHYYLEILIKSVVSTKACTIVPLLL